jgi:hypothetical protein
VQKQEFNIPPRANVVDPIDVLAEHAISEWRAGKTSSLRAFALEEGIDLEQA